MGTAMPDPTILVVVPARGGSVGVPRKNQRLVGGVPLAVRAGLAVLEAGRADGPLLRVVVSTDDPVVDEQCAAAGLPVVSRPDALTGPDVTVADVVVDVARRLGHSGPVAAVQPTAAGLTADTLAEAFAYADPDFTLSTVEAQHGQWWAQPDGADKPVQVGAFVNRQYGQPVVWRETGGLRIAPSADFLEAHGWVHPDGYHLTVELDPDEAVDIDTPADFAAARVQAERLTVLFVVAAGDAIGSGHVRRALTIADELGHHDLRWAWAGDDIPGWAWREVDASTLFGGETFMWPCQVPDGAVVVFDKLDTTVADHALVDDAAGTAVCLEDVGAGAALAAFTVNELYPVGQFTGPGWAVLRPEFAGPLTDPPGGREVLVCFGGTDPAGLNVRVANALASGHPPRPTVTVLANHRDRPPALHPQVRWCRDGLAASFMRAADVVVTSYGRTVNEASALGRPVVAVAANHRELSHVHAPCVTYLGLHATVTDDQLVQAVGAALEHPEWGIEAAGAVSHTGAQRVARLIELAGHP